MKSFLDKIKDYIVGIFIAITSLLGIVAYFLFSKKEHIDYDENKNKAEGRNEIINNNISVEKEKINNLDKSIKDIESNVSDIKNSKNNENLDDFFDKRGF